MLFVKFLIIVMPLGKRYKEDTRYKDRQLKSFILIVCFPENVNMFVCFQGWLKTLAVR